MKGRPPNLDDVERMQQAIALVTAYDLGVPDNEFGLFKELLETTEDPREMLQTVTQFAWLLLGTMDNHGIEKEDVLDWYGKRFAIKGEKLRAEKP